MGQDLGNFRTSRANGIQPQKRHRNSESVKGKQRRRLVKHGAASKTRATDVECILPDEPLGACASRS